MSVKREIYIIPAQKLKLRRNEYTDSLENMFVEAVRVDQNFCTYDRWKSTDYIGPFSELKNGFLSYIT